MPNVLPTILFINKKIPHLLSFKAGGEISINILLSSLQQRNYPVYSIGTVKDRGGFPNLYNSIEDVLKESKRRKYQIKRYIKSKFIELNSTFPVLIYNKFKTFDILKKFINEHPKTVILTQVNGSEDILQSSFILRIPIILFIRDPFRKQDLLCLRQIREKNQKIWIVFNSNFTSQAKRFDRIRKLIPTSVIYPPIEIDKLKNKDISRANFVTLVNPKEKVNVVKDDPSDNILIECALESNSKYIITSDKHLLNIKEYKGIRIIKPEETRAIL